MKNILIINGHPGSKSYCKALSESYAHGAMQAGHNVALMHLHELNFNPNFKGSYYEEKVIGGEADVVMAREKISWSNHIVIIHPVWWGSVPALLKGFFDKVLVPGFAFKYKQNSSLWDKLLSGRTADIIYTSDTPNWYYRLFYRAPSLNMVKDRVLGFCGIKTRRVAGIGPIRGSQDSYRKKWLVKVQQMGASI